MRYVSTRGTAPALNFEDTILTGLARDGGLYVPDDIPRLSETRIAAMAGRCYEDIALEVMRPFVADSFDDDTFAAMIANAYAHFNHTARAPLVQIQPGHFLAELFHGPTLAFKDFAMQLVSGAFQEVLHRRNARLTIVGATSGDTGSAAIEAFRAVAAVDVFILYPQGRISQVQRRQMTTPQEANVHALAVAGDFDDCQALVKALFNDFAFRDSVGMAGINSINWARILAQVVYYFTSATALGAPHRTVDFCVPTGNFGDVFAGYIAKRMGLPIGRLVVATNHNDILHRCLDTGVYATSRVAPSISPSMDIQVSSNFERALFYAHDRNPARVRALMDGLQKTGRFDLDPGPHDALRAVYGSDRVDEARTTATIARVHDQTGQLVCPHTAVGIAAAQAHQGMARAHGPHGASSAMVTLATAHPAKFPDAVEAATGIRPALPPFMADLFDRPERIIPTPNDLDAVKGTIHRILAGGRAA